MIYKNGKELNVNLSKVVITSLHKGSILIWEAINSCFGKGFWVNQKPWINKDGWKNK